MKRRVIGVDLGLRGVAVELVGGVPSRVWPLEPGEKDPGWRYTGPMQWDSLDAEVEGLVQYAVQNCDAIGYEQVIMSRGARTIWGLEALLLARCGGYGCPVFPVNVTTLKSWVKNHVGGTWKGHAKKHDMEMAVPTTTHAALCTLADQAGLATQRFHDVVDAFWVATWLNNELEEVG